MEKGTRIQVRLQDDIREEVEIVQFHEGYFTGCLLSDLEQGFKKHIKYEWIRIKDILTIE